jgi:hypothetical protein
MRTKLILALGMALISACGEGSDVETDAVSLLRCFNDGGYTRLVEVDDGGELLPPAFSDGGDAGWIKTDIIHMPFDDGGYCE